MPSQGRCLQVCPECSDLRREVLGGWDRSRWRFQCPHCGLVLHGDGYERALDNYLDKVWRAEQDAHALDAAARELRRATR